MKNLLKLAIFFELRKYFFIFFVNKKNFVRICLIVNAVNIDITFALII